MRKLYGVIDAPRGNAPGNWYTCFVTFNRADALEHAAREWNHLTDDEKRRRVVSVEEYRADVDGNDKRDAETLYSDLCEESPETVCNAWFVAEMK